MSFSKIEGQTKAVSLLAADLASGRVADSYLFVGQTGVGKRTAALEFAKALNCLKDDPARFALDAGKSHVDFFVSAEDSQLSAPDIEACDRCASCRKIDSQTHPDIFVLNFESQAQLLEMREEEKIKQKDFQIAAIRILISRSYRTPLEGRKKFFIIDGAERLNRESANALLKVLEETAVKTRWILIAVSLDRVLPTIRSRCRKVSFAPLASSRIEELLKEKVSELTVGQLFPTVQLSTLTPLIKEASLISDGSIAIALSLMERESKGLIALAEAVLRAMDQAALYERRSDQDVAPLEISSQILAESKEKNPRKRAELFLKILSLKMCQQMRKRPRLEMADDFMALFQSQEALRRNGSPQLVLDSLLLHYSRPLK